MSGNYIQILDYGIGNIRSLGNALNAINIKTEIKEKINLDDVDLKGLIIPGVGSFPSAMNILSKKNLIQDLSNVASSGLPVLGICLGMQLLFTEGKEIKTSKGLNLLKGQVLPLNNKKIKVPNIGWRKVIKNSGIDKFKDFNHNNFYFVHSFFVEPLDPSIVKYSINYDNFKIPAIVNKHNIYGFQFHPEKSGSNGLELLKNFCNVCL